MNYLVDFFNINFLKKIDRYLLLNRTLLWNSKLHYILFYGAIINITLLSFLLLYKIEIYQIKSTYNTLFYLLLFVTSGAFIYWTYIQKNYIPSAEHSIFKLNGLKEYIIYCSSLSIIIFPLIILVVVTQIKYDKPEFHEYNFYSSEKLPLNVVEKLTSVSEESITIGTEQDAKENLRFIRNWSDSNYFVLWCLTIIVFLPLLLIVYRNIGIKSFLISVVYTSMLLILYIVVVNVFSMRKYNAIYFITSLNIISVFSYFYFKDKSIVVFSALLFNIFLLFFIIIELRLDYIKVTESQNINYMIYFLLISFVSIILIIYTFSKYLVNIKISPKK